MSLPTTQKRKLTEKQQDFLNNIIETKGKTLEELEKIVMK